MKVFVCGSIGYGYKEEIKKLQDLLRKEGFEVLDQFEFDYSDIEDFRDKRELSSEIVKRDLELCDRADVLILIAKHPSFGAMAEAVIASMKGKPVVVFCPEKLRSPWPLYFATAIAEDERELISLLRELKHEIRTIPNVYCDHESEFVYTKFKCVCPVTGLEDRGVVKIRYKPRDRLLEYESLDRYFRSFEGKRMHHEAVACKVYRDLLNLLNPEWLEVTVEFEERSNVRAVVRVQSK